MYEAQIARGAELLDRYVRGDWRSRLNTASLEMGSCSDCVVGQLFGPTVDGGEYTGALRLMGAPSDIRLRAIWASDHGFDALPEDGRIRSHGNKIDYDGLREAWLEYLAAWNVAKVKVRAEG